MTKIKIILSLACTIASTTLLFSCGTHFDINPYDGLYSLVSFERDDSVAETEISLDLPTESKLRIIVVNEHPQSLYGDRFFAYTSKSSTSMIDDSWYCWFFEDCSLSNYSLRDYHVETNKYVFWLFEDLVSNQSKIDPISFSFSWIDETAGTIRIVVEFQSYTIIFEG